MPSLRPNSSFSSTSTRILWKVAQSSHLAFSLHLSFLFIVHIFSPPGISLHLSPFLSYLSHNCHPFLSPFLSTLFYLTFSHYFLCHFILSAFHSSLLSHYIILTSPLLHLSFPLSFPFYLTLLYHLFSTFLSLFISPLVSTFLPSFLSLFSSFPILSLPHPLSLYLCPGDLSILFCPSHQ